MIPRFYLIIIFFLITGFIGFFLIWPVYQGIPKIQLEIKEIENSIQEREEYFLDLKSLSEKLERYQNQLSIIDSALPGKVYLPHFYDAFQKICSRKGLALKGINVSIGSSKGSEIQEIHITLDVLGSHSSFKDFLSYLENSVRFFSIENINFSSASEGELFSVSLSIKTYSY